MPQSIAPTEGKRKYKPHFNFITLHYAYIIGIIILGSIVIYPMKNMRYIDALFFASGAATQSGLNTIDLNLIKTYQQVITWFVPMITTPIFINTVVVYVRLHWFEKRFEHIVSMSRQPSRARTMSMSRQRTGGGDADAIERGIRGREIKVLHTNTMNSGKFSVVEGPDGMMMRPTFSPEDSKTGSVEDVNQRSPSPGNSSSTAAEPPTAEGIKSTGTIERVPPPTANSNIQFVGLPTPQDQINSIDNADHPHIAFVENQRSPNAGRALRIPGPREFDQGHRATEVDEDDTYTLNQTRTRELDRINENGHTPSRSYSMANAGTNATATSNLRMRKLPTVERFLPHATTAISSAFSMGTAVKPKVSRVFSRSASKEPTHMPYLSYRPTMARNSQFMDLTDEQRDELGGIEYRSLKMLAKILVGYYLFFHVFGIVGILPWIYRSPALKKYIESCGVAPWWWAMYTSETTFNDVGFTLTPDSMISFQKSTWLLLLTTFLIVIGNTGFPCLLRFVIWLVFKLSPKNSSMRESLNFLLDHPRRCFTLLFPSRETWVLFWVLIVLNGADVILFIVLDLKDKDVTDIAVGHRIIGAIFQAASTRTAGTSVVNIADLHPAVQVSYMIMMYISIFPIAISVRRTNVYEEKSLGVYTEEDDDEGGSSPTSYIGVHLRKQLSFDLWYIFLGLFIICIAEGHHIENKAKDINAISFSTFAVLFEVVSAYGTVGLSLGYPTKNASFSTMFSTVSKLVIIAMQIRGRHRGLPYELDRAILLPKEQRDAELTSIRRRGSNLSQAHMSAFGRPFSVRAQSIQSQVIEDSDDDQPHHPRPRQ
ncbi:cation transport protein-domain-containing protein [Geopyxis carbonaria]|nr:cation transport protein-domain-containing protein [Geopyxis carbonaria]